MYRLASLSLRTKKTISHRAAPQHNGQCFSNSIWNEIKLVVGDMDLNEEAYLDPK
jgi:hypothetical protein